MKTVLNTATVSSPKCFKFIFFLTALLGIYLIFAWASYSPLDNAWSTASSVTDNAVLNKTGIVGAWLMDLLYAMFGKVTFIIPFSMLGGSLYMLILRLAKETTWKYLVFRTGSFLLFLIGLSGLASVVLSNGTAYLAGGFVGGIFQNHLAESMGQFVALLIAMTFTAVGFYFCSGQVIIPLLTAFYEWVLGKNNTEIDTTNVQKEEENEPLVTDISDETNDDMPSMDALTDPSHFIFANQSFNETPASKLEQEAETETAQFVDPSVFTRQNITGLKTAYPSTEEVSLTDTAMFNVSENVLLPKVHIQPQVAAEQVMPEQPIATQTHLASHQDDLLPTIRLNLEAQSQELLSTTPIEPSVTPVVDVPKVQLKPLFMADDTLNREGEQDDYLDDHELQLAKEFEQAEQARLAQMEARAKSQGIEQVYSQIMNTPTPEISEATATQTVQPQPNEVVYPKGYGDTLIHPLLQRQHQVEKPTTPLPTLNLLEVANKETQLVSEQEIRETSRRIEQALANYGVKATVEDVVIGPVVTRYEIKPAAGVKAAKITGLANDLARELMFEAIRITEVVPGKPYMGIETPSKQRETVWLRNVLASEAFRQSKAILPMAIGLGINGDPVVIDMAKTPHLLVAGQTGAGKSVGLNSMILSLLYKFTPEQLKFIMIDPKVVELSIYNDIPHLLTPVVVDMKKAANALRWAVEEMERRYKLVSHLNVRNIEGYNAKIDQAAEMQLPIPDPEWRPSSSMDKMPPALTKLSYIVLIVDEFGDLLASAGKEIEDHITRIAQKARAVGIHLILATQRPSTDVITGVIKANIPSRIAFTVATQIDSRTILDKGGAESLLGYGDMLYSGAGSPDIIRVHGAYMNDEDVVRVADDWRARGKPNYLDSILESAENEESGKADIGDLDPLFDEIVEYVIETGVTSISGIQRRFSLGFNRAGRIIDQMEAQGIISEAGKNGKREILAR